MSKYKKYIMMGVSIILIPLAKMALSKIISSYFEKPEPDSEAEENETFANTRRPYEQRVL